MGSLTFAILISEFINWFYTQQYSVAGMTGFKIRYSQIEDTPWPPINQEQGIQIIKLVDSLMESGPGDRGEIMKKINEVVKALYEVKT